MVLRALLRLIHHMISSCRILGRIHLVLQILDWCFEGFSVEFCELYSMSVALEDS